MTTISNPDKASGQRDFEGVMYARAITGLAICTIHGYNYFGKIGFVRASLLFFIISGFMIALTSAQITVAGDVRASLDFARKRLIRIVPLYWLMVALQTGDHWPAWWEASGSLRELYWNWNATLTSFVKDLFFIPHLSYLGGPRMWPAVVPAWTLNYEMVFYALFTLSILLGRWKIALAIGLLSGLALYQFYAFPPDAGTPLYKWFAWLEFATGLLMFVVWRRYPQLHPRARTAAAIIVLGFLTGALGIIEASHFWVSLGCSALVWGFLFVPGGRHWILRGLRKIGDASYCLYISHTVIALPIAFAMFDWLGARTRVDSGDWGLPAIVLMLAWCTVMGIATAWPIHRYIERPMVGFLLRLGRPAAGHPRAAQIGAQRISL